MPTTLNNLVNAVGKDTVAIKSLRDVMKPHWERVYKPIIIKNPYNLSNSLFIAIA